VALRKHCEHLACRKRDQTSVLGVVNVYIRHIAAEEVEPMQQLKIAGYVDTKVDW
jgi:hypothetical protein